MIDARLQQEAVLRVGEVTEVTGRRISVTVDKDKNLSELFFEGDLIRNVAVGSYIDIRKGFFSLIGKVDGEFARPDTTYLAEASKVPNSKRSLSIRLCRPFRDVLWRHQRATISRQRSLLADQ